ncbi:MAG: molybdopterin molybdotransferase MoeA [Pirellulaceae bacterium]|nr:molybdopterin molybdotransferase MoeA [Pirellulaceae bacterium]
MNQDVRMRGFATRTDVNHAIQWVDGHSSLSSVESISLLNSAGRVLADTVSSAVNVPGFRRAMMDGFAVRAQDVLGAGSYNPIELEVVGEILPGENGQFQVGPRQAVRVMTGAEVPASTDAVVPVESTEFDADHQGRVLILSSIPQQKNVAKIGEDVAVGEGVLSNGRRLRPQDVGVLASIGIAAVEVYRKPRVRIIVTGNELLPPGSCPQGVQIVDSNSPMLQALIERDGGEVIHPGIIRDDPNQILMAMQDACDVLLVSGGSSTGREDFAPGILRKHGELPIHGIAMRPSSPAGMGIMGNRPVFLLPGNPVSCLCAYDFFAGRCIRRMSGRSGDWPYSSECLPLSSKLVSVVGRTDYARVQITENGVRPIAISGASILSSTTKADGFCIIPADSEGYAAGTEIEVYLY